MLLRQLIDYPTNTYTYLLADETTRAAALIDPVKEHRNAYLTLLRELDLQLIAALDTHVHADHVTALGDLREATGCQTYVGAVAGISCADQLLRDGDSIDIGQLRLQALHTPGHTDDSMSYYLPADATAGRPVGYLFSGDTLFIRGTGRTDFQNGSAAALYDSLFNKLLTLPPDTQVLPGHDYNGRTVSTIGEERTNNPRLAVADRNAFIAMMNALVLPDPKRIHEAVPANRACGRPANN